MDANGIQHPLHLHTKYPGKGNCRPLRAAGPEPGRSSAMVLDWFIRNVVFDGGRQSVRTCCITEVLTVNHVDSCGDTE